jgi:hypothetical protein
MATNPPLLGTARDWARELGVATAVGAFLGVIGPFGSYANDSVASRILHFVVCFWVGTLIFGLAHRLAVAGARRIGAPLWLALVAAAIVGCGVLSIFVGWLAVSLWPFLAGKLSPLDWFAQCLLLSGPVLLYMLVREGVVRLPGRPPPVEVTPATAEPPLAGEVLCLQMEDHYVRIHGPLGSRLVAGPFDRVIASLSDVEGLRVHRSWWVARAAVEAAQIDGRNLRLKLSNGLSAPVARASVATLRAAGWLS